MFNWFKAHDGDEDEQLDGLELVKALGHEHNFHHEARILTSSCYRDNAENLEKLPRPTDPGFKQLRLPI